MIANKKLLTQLLLKLKIGNRNSNFLNAFDSPYKLYLSNLEHLKEHLSDELLEKLRHKEKFKQSIYLNTREANKNKNKTKSIGLKLRTICFQNETLKQERGINTLAIGYPLLVRRSKSDNKLMLSPLLLWKVDLYQHPNEANRWLIEKKNKHEVVLNPVLINQIEKEEEIKLKLNEIETNVFEKEELSTFCTSLLKQLNPGLEKQDTAQPGLQYGKISEIKEPYYYEKKTGNNSWIEWSGVLGLFKLPKEGIINNYESLLKDEIKLESKPCVYKQFNHIPFPAIDLDPDQQKIIHALKDQSKILIQGPPGTGKSQVITAIVINKLLNRKPVLIVSEKKTALKVIKNRLKEKGIGHLAVIIEDSVADRNKIVEETLKRFETNDSYQDKELPKYEHILNKLNYFERLAQKHENLYEKELFEGQTFEEISKKYKPGQSFSKIHYQYDPKSFLKVKEAIVFLDGCSKEELMLSEQLSESFFLQDQLLAHQKLNKEVSFFIKHTPEINNLIVEVETFIDEIIKEYEKWKQEKEILNSKIEKTDKELKSKNVYKKINKKGDPKKWFKLTSKLFKKSREELKLFELLNEYKRQIAVLNRSQFERLQKKQNINDTTVLKDKIIPASRTSQLEKILKTKQALLGSFQEGFLISDDDNTKRLKEVIVNVNTTGQLDVKKIFNIKENKKVLSEQNIVYPVNQTTPFIETITQFIINQQVEKLGKQFQNFGEKELISFQDHLKQFKSAQLDYINQHFERQLQTVLNQTSSKNINALFNKRNSKNRRRTSLSKIISESDNLFFNAFPVLLVSPEVAAEILPIKENLFESVLFDESSQLKLEDVYPILHRAKQVIVAGDSKQMPPITPFENIAKLNTEDEESFLAESDSLLDHAIQTGYKNYFLNFHYRSKSSNLIDFSNAHFYNSNLKLMKVSSSNFPELVEVGGVFEDHQNIEEAKTIIDRLKKVPDNTNIGIVAMNTNQRDLIQELLFEEVSKDPNFALKYQTFLNNNIMIRNVENIQGEERDLIFISLTYGIKEDGKFYKNLGYFNKKFGPNILNVLLTRSKKEMVVFSSIPPEHYKGALVKIKSDNTSKPVNYLFGFVEYLKFQVQLSKYEENSLFGLEFDEFDKKYALDHNLNQSFKSTYNNLYKRTLGINYKTKWSFNELLMKA